MTTLRKWNKDEIRALLDAKDAAVERAIVVLYERQTADEQVSGMTCHLNGKGFNGRDAEFGTSLAKQIAKYGHLTARQVTYARKMVRKYAGQLALVANEKASKGYQQEVVDQPVQ